MLPFILTYLIKLWKCSKFAFRMRAFKQFKTFPWRMYCTVKFHIMRSLIDNLGRENKDMSDQYTFLCLIYIFNEK